MIEGNRVSKEYPFKEKGSGEIMPEPHRLEK